MLIVRRPARRPRALRSAGRNYDSWHGRVHLHHEERAQDARGQGHPRQRDHPVLSRRQDRCRRSQRGWQVDRAAHHGRTRPTEQRRSLPHPGLHRRHHGAGASAQRGEDGPGQRRGGRRRDQAEAEPLQRDRREARHRLLRRAHGGDGPAPGGAGPRGGLGARFPARTGDGRPALPAAGRHGQEPLRR